MPDLKYTITAVAQGTGVKQTTEDLKKLTATSEGAKTEIKSTAAETDKATISKGKLSAAVQKLAHEFPILGTVASAIKHPLIGVAAAIALVIREIFKQIEAQNKLAETAGETISKLTLLEGSLLKGSDNARQFTDSARALKDALAAVTAEARDPTKAIESSEKQIDKQLEREKEVLKTRKEFVTAKIERDRVKGEISDEEAARRKGSVENFFAKETARIEEVAAQKKIEGQAEAHMQAQKDFQGAKDANEDAVRGVKEAKDVRDAFQRGEKVAAEERAKRDTELAEKEKTAQSEVARLQPIAQQEIAREEQLGGGTISPLGQQRLAMSVNQQALQRAVNELKGVQAERKTIATTGRIQARKGRDLGIAVTEAEKFEQETIKAAAAASGMAESTRKAVIEGTIESRATTTHADELGILRQKITETAAEIAAYKELLEATKENAALRKREIEQIKSENSEIKQRLSSAANKTQ